MWERVSSGNCSSLRPFTAWACFGAPLDLVTDDGADPEQVQKFRDAGVEVEVAATAP
ncbi:hypothetical protein [Pseudarthrobacter sulfonivorans]|uniref:hypothetical protein n=1 Tax=Pseudarthrobacter sulfonivorans TaxID=121292 RepID=UPI001CC2B3D0|nr:hypothetical protein [Pseudarthrobacter sulfonivorans]